MINNAATFLIKLIGRVVAPIFLLLLTSCATGMVSIENLDVSIGQLQQIIEKAMPVKLRKEEPSGREFKSAYFIQKKGEFEENDGGAIRYFVRVTIEGDRRPYTINVQVPVEKRVGENQYEVVKYDEGTARVVIRRIQKGLHDRPEDRNIIDDFRAF